MSEGQRSSDMETMRYVRTGFSDLDYLLSTGGPNGDPERMGICCHPQHGFFGVIVGPAGSGKSVLALQLCCSHVASGRGPAIYVTQEAPDVVSSKIQNSFALFGMSADQVRIRKNLDLTDVGAVVIQQLLPEEAQQSDLITEIFDGIDRRRRRGSRVLLCVDVADSLSSESFLKASRASQKKLALEKNVYKRYRTALGSLGIDAYFALEEGRDDFRYETIAATDAAYAADLLIHLGIETKSGYRQRRIEIVKSKNQYCFRGRHSFSIAGADAQFLAREKPKPFGIRIYPSVATQLSWLAREAEYAAQRAGNTTYSASEPPSAIATTPPSVATSNSAASSLPPSSRRRDPNRAYLGIVPGGESSNEERASDWKDEFWVERNTSTVLVSDIDIMATYVACEFARQAKSALYISFLHRDLEALWPIGDGHVRFEYFPPEHIDEGKLMHDIDVLLNRSPRPEVVVIDNALELGCKYPLITGTPHFLSALLELFRARGVTSLIVDMVEVGVGGNPIEKSIVAGLGENVIALRSVEFQSRAHTVFSVQKHRSLTESARRIWHLERVDAQSARPDQPRFRAKRTFDAYKEVLTGRPEPVTFAVSIYQDEPSSPLTAYIEAMRGALKRTFGRSIAVEYYSGEEYAKVQNLTLLSERSALADCHIMALDEFWLAKLIKKERLEDITAYAADLEGAFRALAGEVQADLPADQVGIEDPFVTAASDIATLSDPRWPNRWCAVPILNNFGVLCCDPAEVMRRYEVRGALKAWLAREDDESKARLKWSDLVTLKESRPWHETGDEPDRFFGLTMDHIESPVSMLLELALSYGDPFTARRDDPKNTSDPCADLELDLKDPAWNEALDILLQLLDEEDLDQLASLRLRPASAERLALFSRQWISSLGSLRGVHPRRVAASRLQAYELPLGKRNCPTPVSGIWYLGILKGSAAVGVGVKILEAFCSSDSEISKWNVFLGAPVRRSFYDGPLADRRYGPFGVPYSKRFAAIGKTQGDIRDAMRRDENQRAEAQNRFKQEVLADHCPFHRMRIRDYDLVGMILWRMMGRAARDWLAVGMNPKERTRKITDAIASASDEYKSMIAPRRANAAGAAARGGSPASRDSMTVPTTKQKRRRPAS